MDPEANQMFVEDQRKYSALFVSTRKNMHGMHFLILGLYVGIKQCNKQEMPFNKMQCNIKRKRKRRFIVGMFRFNCFQFIYMIKFATYEDNK